MLLELYRIFLDQFSVDPTVLQDYALTPRRVEVQVSGGSHAANRLTKPVNHNRYYSTPPPLKPARTAGRTDPRR